MSPRTRPPSPDRCPEGHASITQVHVSDGYRCRTCDRTYRGDPYDARETEFPVPGEHDHVGDSDRAAYDAILAEIVEIAARETRTWVKTREVGANMNRAAKMLSVLADRGLVEQLSRSTREAWRPTPAGRARVETEVGE